MRFFHKSACYATGWVPVKINDEERVELKRWFKEEHPDHKIQNFENDIFLETKENTGIIFEKRVEEYKGNDLVVYVLIISLFLNAIQAIGVI